MDVMHLSAECYPVAKVGGLGDVVGALPKYLCSAGINASVVLPYYDRPFVREHAFTDIFSGTANGGGRDFDYKILRENNDTLGFPLYLVYIKGLLDRPEVYCYPDEIKQFISYQVAVTDWISRSVKKPDIIHCHDHHSGLVPFFVSHTLKYRNLTMIPTVCTIHNGQYQGWLDWDKISYLPAIDVEKAGLLDWNHSINSLAASVKCCWKFTTVSPSYMQELSHNSNGLEGLFRMEKQKGVGIINGIDTRVWDPQTDQMIPSNYSPDNVQEGKKKNKASICKQFRLSDKLPLVVFIGRLVGEKGAELLPVAIRDSLKSLDNNVNYIVLGSGEKNVEGALTKVAADHPKHCGVFIGYDEELSHKLYAAADFLLMPSRVEPCGLNQLYAVRYGTMPIVHATGGLKDTVIDIDNPGGYGVTFGKLSAREIVRAIDRAVDVYATPGKLRTFRKRMMMLDFSWDRSAEQYINLYLSLTGSHAT